jgi:hypothetical protein
MRTRLNGGYGKKDSACVARGGIRELSEKAHAGRLTVTEERELDSYLNVGRTLEFLKAKARLSLQKNTTR